MESRAHRLVAALAVGGALVVTVPRAVAADATKGADVYKTHQCAMCHKVNGAGGKLGPDLSAVGTKRDAKWLEKYLPNPKAVNPKTKMPPAKVTAEELRDLIDYLGTLKSGK